MSSSHDPNVQHSLSNAEISRYSRQLIMPDIGPSGQMQLKQASVLVIGAGGLGCPVAIYLTAAGVGRIGIVDHDSVELSNLHRQILHSEQRVGTAKADSAAEQCRRLNSDITIDAINDKFTSANALALVERYDIVLDCTDNVVTRYLINDACVLGKKPLVSGAALGMEGHVCVYNYNGGPCHRCLHPLPPPPETVVSCSEGGVLGIVPGIIGSVQALEAIRLILRLHSDSSSAGREMRLFNAIDCSMRVVTLRKRVPECDICGDSPTIRDLSTDYEQFCGVPACDTVPQLQRMQADARCSIKEFANAYHSKQPFLLLDVRPQCEYEICRLNNSINIPLSQLAQPAGKTALYQAIQQLQLSSSDCSDGDSTTANVSLSLFIVCRRGNDSQEAARILQEQLAERGCTVRDVAGGLTAWAKHIDNQFPIY